MNIGSYRYFHGIVMVVLGTLLCSPLTAGEVAVKRTPVQPLVANDINPSPTTVEVILTATEHGYDFGSGQETMVYTYNGSIPGPTIVANLGDTLIVHFTNNLPEATTIHWHGSELPAAMDGSHIAQNPIPPGGTFRYEFKLLRATLSWFHPHIRTHVQVEKGLYGMLLVHDPDQNASLGLPENEHVLVLDDILLDDAAQVAEAFPADPLENTLTQVNGREGNSLLVNGKTAFADTIANGVPHRLRIANVANARFMRVSIRGHRMWRIGGDGGLLETPIEIQPVEQVADPENPDNMISDPDITKGLLLSPAERADIVFTPMVNDSIVIEWHDIARGRHSASYDSTGAIALGHDHHDGHHPPQTLAVLYLDGTSDSEYIPPTSLRSINKISADGAAKIPVMFGHSLPDSAGNVTFFAQMKDGKPLPMDKVTPEDAPKVNIGDVRIWEVNNMTGGMHNFHSHGFHFQLIETEYLDMDNPASNRVVPAEYLEDKDTILLFARPGAKGRSRTITRLAVWFDDAGREAQIVAEGKEPTASSSGGWLFHCHILEHAARGMMSFLQVIDNETFVEGGLASVPETYYLQQNYPNPFNPETKIRFELPQGNRVLVKVYNILGAEVGTLLDEQLDAGIHEVSWDGKDTNGIAMASGLYFYQLRVGEVSQVRKMSLVR